MKVLIYFNADLGKSFIVAFTCKLIVIYRNQRTKLDILRRKTYLRHNFKRSFGNKILFEKGKSIYFQLCVGSNFLKVKLKYVKFDSQD